MDNQISEKKPVARYEPGELERTRKNLGNIDKEEALRMIKTLGGEIGVEKSAPIDMTKMPKKPKIYGSRMVDSRPISQSQDFTQEKKKKVSQIYTLPEIDQRVRSSIDEMMIDQGIRTKPNFFTAFINWALNRKDLISHDFVTGSLNIYVTNTVKFVDIVKGLISNATEHTKKQIDTNQNLYYRSLKKINSFNSDLILKLYNQVYKHASDASVKSIQTLTKELFKFLYCFYFLGEGRVQAIIKQLSTDILTKKNINQEAIQVQVREASGLWIFIYSQVYKGMYPILLRLCCKEITPFTTFYTAESSNILKFLELTKFEVLLPEKEPDSSAQKESTEKKRISPEEEREIYEQKSRMELFEKGISILDIMFPEAGWKNLDKMPDMYGYFEPLYDFPEGFDYLSPENPMQITAILIRILDDFFTGCRYINFSPDEQLQQLLGTSDVQSLIDSWGSYLTVLFERHYLTSLKEIVNNVDAKLDYTESQFGGRALSNLFWYAKNQFLPLLRFDLKFLDRPKADSMLKPVFRQVPNIRKAFEEIIKRAEKVFAQNPTNANDEAEIGATKLWTHYHFPMPNCVSKRLDVLLGGKNSTNTNKLNLLKYTACVLSVLDWWINDPNSPAYAKSASCPFRKDADGHPVFTTPVMSNVDSLFAKHIRSRKTASK